MSDVAFTTEGIGRVFLACHACGRVIPHWKVYGRGGDGRCRCGSNTFRPARIPEWKAAFYVLVLGWLWRKTIRKQAEWDPRMPVRRA